MAAYNSDSAVFFEETLANLCIERKESSKGVNVTSIAQNKVILQK